MELSKIGERKIVEMITKKFAIPMDDCAIIDFDGQYLIITTDMVYEKTHFPEGAKPYQKGWYAMAVNLSDIASKGGIPIAFDVAIGMPRDYEMNFLKELINGMEDCIKEYGGNLVGGDTKETDFLTMAVTAIGKVPRDEFMPRKGTKAGDAVYVTGNLGKEASLYKNDFDKLLLIKPRIKEGRFLARTKYVTSCMDISDGLASSLYQLSKINNVGFRIYEDMLPLSEEALKMEKPIQFALYHGGDFELLFTVPEEKGKKIEKRIDVKKIGYVTKNKKILLIKNGKESKIWNKGYEHFKS